MSKPASDSEPNDGDRWFAPESLTAYHNGEWCAASALSLSLEDLGVKQGVTAVERLRTYNGHVFLVDRHLSRLSASARGLGISGLPTPQAMTSLLAELITRNADKIGSLDVSVVVVATPGRGNGEPTLMIRIEPIDLERVDRYRLNGQRLVITDIVQPPPESWSRQWKVRSRIHYYLADAIAHASDQSAAGVLLDASDANATITETSVANIAIVENGTVISPPQERVLGGVSQSLVEELARQANIAWHKAPITPDGLRTADEVLLMGTTAGLWFASTIDDRPVKQTPGPVFVELRNRFDWFIDASGQGSIKTCTPD